jgi:hypothetical protein
MKKKKRLKLKAGQPAENWSTVVNKFKQLEAEIIQMRHGIHSLLVRVESLEGVSWTQDRKTESLNDRLRVLEIPLPKAELLSDLTRYTTDFGLSQ